MQLRLISEQATCPAEYGGIPIEFEVRERIDLTCLRRGARASDLRTRRVTPPYVKNYDAIAVSKPSNWARRWDLSKWSLIAAIRDGRWIGAGAIVLDARELEGAASPADTAVLWDIRVHLDGRREGIGRQLLAFAEGHARTRGIRRMRIETQDVNVPACRFYAGAGYVLAAVNRGAYVDIPDEVQLIWEKGLT